MGTDKLKWLNLLFDYDGATINAGMRIACFRHLFITAGTINFDSFTGTISYHIHLIQ